MEEPSALSRGTRFPNLPKLPDPSAPLKALLKSFQDLRQQGEEAMTTAEELKGTLQEGIASVQQSAGQRLKAPLPKFGPPKIR